MMARYTHFSAAVSAGKWPRALTALRIRALTDSMAFVVPITVRMWVWNCRNGTNSGHADYHSLMIAGYWWPHASVRATNASRAADSLGAA
jgi:hypothetical protein